MTLPTGEKFLVIGASRGLGRACLELLLERQKDCIGISRKFLDLTDFLSSKKERVFQWHSLDASRPADFTARVMEIIHREAVTHVLYLPAGGPYGPFSQYDLKDHLWSFRVTFETPMALVHRLLRETTRPLQLTFIGSLVADSSTDANAASYCASKHALKGLVATLQEELTNAPSALDLRYYRAPYMTTDLLPKNSAPRLQGKAVEPRLVAQDLIQWLLETKSLTKFKDYESGQN